MLFTMCCCYKNVDYVYLNACKKFITWMFYMLLLLLLLVSWFYGLFGIIVLMQFC